MTRAQVVKYARESGAALIRCVPGFVKRFAVTVDELEKTPMFLKRGINVECGHHRRPGMRSIRVCRHCKYGCSRVVNRLKVKNNGNPCMTGAK